MAVEEVGELVAEEPNQSRIELLWPEEMREPMGGPVEPGDIKLFLAPKEQMELTRQIWPMPNIRALEQQAQATTV